MPHVPVMLAEVLDVLAPRDDGTYVDGTFGAGGYTRAILAAARCRVIAIDRDPAAISAGQALVEEAAGRLVLAECRFGDMVRIVRDRGVQAVDGIVIDIGVSSMQIDDPARGFSFLRDGPLDMRMSQQGASAADAVNSLPQEALSNIIYTYGEEPRSRAIARAIVAARAEAPITTTGALVKAVERAVGRQRPQDRTHPATRTFQALRIHVNGELDELVDALHAAEQLLAPGGRLVAVTFHSLEDRIVKRFLAERSGKVPAGSRHMPEATPAPPPSFSLPFKGHLEAGAAEVAANPRARSAKLRAAVRTAAAPLPSIAAAITLRPVQTARH
ncbi:MAG: 16S rRNA (cytosine(1402)-N(4))-methyltransferase RsmH [Alphaproteobacteria bacterium]|nr:16S rRNA (cytosine(1402)-N(4))-methyltransferase RsmH [Alphaproteobacteria bacterium]